MLMKEIKSDTDQKGIGIELTIIEAKMVYDQLIHGISRLQHSLAYRFGNDLIFWIQKLEKEVEKSAGPCQKE